MGKIKKDKLKKSGKPISKSTDVPVKPSESKKKLKKKSLKRKLEEAESPEVAPEDVDTTEDVLPEEDDSDLEFEDEEMLDEEDSSDEELSSDRHRDLMANGDSEEVCDFDFEAFPMEEDDKAGIVNMLTQIFLRADVDTSSMADEIIKQSPFGNVVGPAVDNSDQLEEITENVVYGVVSVIPLDGKKEDGAKYVKSVRDLLLQRARKSATKETLEKFDELLKTKLGFLVNERMLNFPTHIVAPSFSSLNVDLAGLKKPYKNVLYIQKLRCAESTNQADVPSTSSDSAPAKKKKKKGKAEKKRAALAALANADIIYDNQEDAELLKLSVGSAYYFDYPVHNDVEPDSKFHIMEKDGKKYKPYRRAVIMDSERFAAFTKKLASIDFE